jgi:hypothetical protein
MQFEAEHAALIAVFLSVFVVHGRFASAEIRLIKVHTCTLTQTQLIYIACSNLGDRLSLT